VCVCVCSVFGECVSSGGGEGGQVCAWVCYGQWGVCWRCVCVCVCVCVFVCVLHKMCVCVCVFVCERE
jgi:hypothetical protein